MLADVSYANLHCGLNAECHAGQVAWMLDASYLRHPAFGVCDVLIAALMPERTVPTNLHDL